jgi:hypothetical protein
MPGISTGATKRKPGPPTPGVVRATGSLGLGLVLPELVEGAAGEDLVVLLGGEDERLANLDVSLAVALEDAAGDRVDRDARVPATRGKVAVRIGRVEAPAVRKGVTPGLDLDRDQARRGIGHLLVVESRRLGRAKPPQGQA